MAHFDDAWLRVDQTSDPSFFVRFLDESRARSLEFARKNPGLAFAHLALQPGQSVLECGCGTGDVLALIAKLVAPGQAIGIDLSEAMISEARRRAAVERPANLRFEVMDVQSLSFPAQSFDRVLATQLLVHLPDPRRVVRDIGRVTRPNGLVALAEMDWDCLVVGASDKELGRRFTHLFCDGLRNGLLVRDLAGWLRSDGFKNVRIIPQPILFDSWDFVRRWLIEPSLPHFVARGFMTEKEAVVLFDDLVDREKDGCFFASSIIHTVMGER